MKTSDSTLNIFPALAKAQGEMTDPPKNADNDFFHSSYLTLTAMHKMSRPVLADNGLAVVQSYTEHGLETLLAHSSGEWILLDPIPIKAEKQTAQGIGSAVTYSMRYALGGLCQVAGDDDDDGNAASAPGEKACNPHAADKPLPENAPDQTDMYRAEIKAWLIEMSAGEPDMFSDLLEMNTEFTDKKGQLIRGKRDLKDLKSDAWVKTTHHRVKQAHEEWKNPPAEGMDDYPK